LNEGELSEFPISLRYDVCERGCRALDLKAIGARSVEFHNNGASKMGANSRTQLAIKSGELLKL